MLLRSKAELDSFCNALKALGVLEAMRLDPVILQDFFTQCGVAELTAGWLMSLLIPILHLIYLYYRLIVPTLQSSQLL